MNINFSIRQDKYPFLFSLKENKQNEIINKIFDIGYNYLFKTEQETISVEDDLRLKISSLEDTMGRLIGLSTSSMKKGEFAENILEDIINDKYSDIKYMNMAQVDHSGDAWVQFDNSDEYIMIESKNYTKKVNTEEVDKMKNDMITNNIKWGIFYSWNSNIQNFKNFDILTFNNNNTTFTILLISNVINNMNMIDMSLMIIRKLIVTYSNTKTFPWITNKIKSELMDLDKIITLNYQLRTNYLEMEKHIKISMEKYYTTLREYQHNIDSSVKKIINEINNTIDNSLDIDNNNFNYAEYLNCFTKNKKIFTLMSKIIDIFQNKNITINNNNIYFQNNEIGNIKIQTKKVIIFIKKFNAFCEFNIDEENKESFNFLNLIS